MYLYTVYIYKYIYEYKYGYIYKEMNRKCFFVLAFQNRPVKQTVLHMNPSDKWDRNCNNLCLLSTQRCSVIEYSPKTVNKSLFFVFWQPKFYKEIGASASNQWWTSSLFLVHTDFPHVFASFQSLNVLTHQSCNTSVIADVNFSS